MAEQNWAFVGYFMEFLEKLKWVETVVLFPIAPELSSPIAPVMAVLAIIRFAQIKYLSSDTKKPNWFLNFLKFKLITKLEITTI